MRISPGRPLPLGCSIAGGTVNFAVFSRHAERVDLLLFDDAADSDSRAWAIELGASCHRTGDIWHVGLEGLARELRYAWRVHGPYEPERGHRFNPHKVLLDPCAVALVGTDCWDFACACGDDQASHQRGEGTLSTRDNTDVTPKCLVFEPEDRFLMTLKELRRGTSQADCGAGFDGGWS